MPDPRKPRGVRHQITTILTLAVCAVVAGCRSFTAIGEWAVDASDQVLSALGVRCAPCESTMRRALQRLDGEELDSASGSRAARRTEPSGTRRRLVAVDGKRVRGSDNVCCAKTRCKSRDQGFLARLGGSSVGWPGEISPPGRVGPPHCCGGPLRTVHATRRRTRLRQAERAGWRVEAVRGCCRGAGCGSVGSRRV